MNRIIHIGLMILFGFFLMPTISYACNLNHHSIQESSTQEVSTKSISDKLPCCDQNDIHENNCCSGDCQNDCCCVNVPSNLLFPFLTEYNYSFFSEIGNNIFKLNQPVSTGFNTIWLPPKIGFSLFV